MNIHKPERFRKRPAVIERDTLLSHLHQMLEADRFKDYGPNGLQVEGKTRIHKVVTGVTASLALIEAAVAEGADALLVHHGLFWRGQDGRVTGWMRQRLATLLRHDINLIAYHLPLDAHALLVHHGLFWRGQDGRVTGWMRQRLATLLRHDINLIAYHLPLDAHASLGNNAQWGQRL